MLTTTTASVTRITEREYAVEVDTALAAFWDAENALNQPLVWAIDALYREAGVDEVGKKYRYYDKPKPQATFKQVLLALEWTAGAPRADREWDARSAGQALGKYREARAKMDEMLAAQEEFNNEYADCGWTRAFLVLNTGGHVHKDRHCSTCYPTTSYGWLPQLSGSSENEIVAASGSDACTICYPSAPVESLSRPRTALHQTEVEAQQAREAKAAAKAAKDAAKAAKALLAPVPGPHGKIETILAAKTFLTDAAGWPTHPYYTPEKVRPVAEALSAKTGETVEDILAAAAKRAAKRR